MYVYIVSNSKLSPLYIGVTNDLIRRVYEHKNKIIKGYTEIYNCTILLHYEVLENPYDAISREKQLKNWHKNWKLNLIKEQNPNLIDLYNVITQ